jgi:hypothetical protein
MSLRLRLGKLERKTRPRPNRRWTMRDFLEEFERLSAGGYFDGEPDFAEALEEFRDEVEAGEDAGKAWWWLGEMFDRVAKGRPAVTREALVELSSWWSRNWPQHRELFDPNLRVYLGDHGSPNAIRCPGITAVFERLQRLRARHPELP